MVDIFQVPGSAQLLARDLQNIVDALKGSNSMEEFLKFEGIVENENENKENPWSVIDSNGVTIDQSSSERRAKDRLWEIEVECREIYEKHYKFPLSITHEKGWNE